MASLPPPPTPPPLGPSAQEVLEGKGSATSAQLLDTLFNRDLQRFRSILDAGFKQLDLTRSMEAAVNQNLPDFVSEIIRRGFPSAGVYAVNAIKRGSKEIIRIIQDSGWDINEPGNIYANSVLGFAIRDKEMTSWLLDRGADPNRESFIGDTPTSIAVHYAPLQVVKLLFERGADAQKGKLLHHALNREDSVIEILDLLLAKGAPINSIMYEPGSNGWMFYFWMGAGTPLQKAVELGKVKVVQYLLEKGADPSIQNPKHQTPLDMAMRLGYFEIVGLLQSYQ